ncbi:arad-like aldolase/epimerase [Corynespora cassiicola Philippines]|uniref:Arad-like aldolase/epimerase n=1 Tax=Corynespora cassiicola Philippines TaxID=1448308 RepID=A0A2T2P6X6_CORCC|nr:arad-like aldolase/epimerase [Corynespora cassiicola Philippines]
MPLFQSNLEPEVQDALRLLIRANHILHNHALVDAFGHISIRHPTNPSTYIISSYTPGAPALVSNAEHFIQYNIGDSTPTSPPEPQGYSERFIHGEIFRRFPKVNCVVHSHSESVIPFVSAGVPIKPLWHMAGFLGAEGVPVFDAGDVCRREGLPDRDMLIKNAALGSALAECFAFSEEQGSVEVLRPVVMQAKHGFTCVGPTIQRAVYRAVYLQKNCELLSRSMQLRGGVAEGVSYLNEEEAKSCEIMNEKTEDKAFRLWLKEVQINPLYSNEEGEPEGLSVGGMNPDK